MNVPRCTHIVSAGASLAFLSFLVFAAIPVTLTMAMQITPIYRVPLDDAITTPAQTSPTSDSPIVPVEPDLVRPIDQLPLERNDQLSCPIVPSTKPRLPTVPFNEKLGDCALKGKGKAIETYLAALEAIARGCRDGVARSWEAVGDAKNDLDDGIDALRAPTPPSEDDGLSSLLAPRICSFSSPLEPSEGAEGLPEEGYYYTAWLTRIRDNVVKYCRLIDELMKPLANACKEINEEAKCMIEGPAQGGVSDAAKTAFHSRLNGAMSSATINHDYITWFYDNTLQIYGWGNFRKYFNEESIECPSGELFDIPSGYAPGVLDSLPGLMGISSDTPLLKPRQARPPSPTETAEDIRDEGYLPEDPVCRELRSRMLAILRDYSWSRSEQGQRAYKDLQKEFDEKCKPMRFLPPAGYQEKVITHFDLYANPFPDTDTEAITGQAAAELYRRGVIGGFPNGTFGGAEPVNRAQAAKMLLIACNHPTDAPHTGRLRDIGPNEWYTGYVEAAFSLGIISGHPDGTFRPADTVLRSEFSKMLTNACGLVRDLAFTFTDVPDDAWYRAFAGAMEEYEIFPDATDGRMKPGKLMSRDDVAVAIYQYLANRTGFESTEHREVPADVPSRAACEAKCRDQYGGSGSAGFDACIRACGAGGVLRTNACAKPGPACPSPQTPVCHGGRWYCREHPPAEGRTTEDLNFPSEEQLREACGEPGLACEVPTVPVCRNGKWDCGRPATSG